MNDAASLARNTAALAMSSVIPARRIGCRVANKSDMTPNARSALAPSSPAALAKMPVTMPPGEIVLTRTPRLLISDATLRDK
jgi:hypothetical protein